MRIDIPRKMNASTYFLDDNLEAGRANKPVLYFNDQQITYAELSSRVNSLGKALQQEFGVQIGDRVLMIMHDSPDFVTAYYAAMRIGAVPVPVNTFFMLTDYLYILDDSRAKVLIADAALVDFVKSHRKDLPQLKHVIYVEPSLSEADNTPCLPQIYSAYYGELDPVIVTSDDMAYWLYSSGTTGFPKGVVHLHHDLLYCDLYGQQILGFTEHDRSFTTSKCFFAYALSNGVHIPLKNGGSTVLVKERLTPQIVSGIFNKWKPTLFFSVPTFYSLLLKETIPVSAFASVRGLVSAGEYLSTDLFLKWKQVYEKPITEGLGSTEFTYNVISNVMGQEKPGSTGKVVPGNEIKLLDDYGCLCPPGQVGTLYVKSEGTGAYYWNQHQKTKSSFVGEWLNTGDCFYQDDDGHLYNVGRGDDLIKSSGIWVYPIEVESVIRKHPDVEEAAVVGEVHDEGLVKVVAYIKLSQGIESDDETRARLLVYLREQLPGYKCPKVIRFVDDLPKTATGKTMRYKLTEKRGVS